VKASPRTRARIFAAQLVAVLMVALGLVVIGGTAAAPAGAAPPSNNCQTTGDGWVKPSDSASGTVTAAFGSLSWDGTADGDAKTQVAYTLKAGFTLELCVKAGQGDYYSPVITVPAGQQQVSGVYDTDDQYGVSHIAYRVRVVIPGKPTSQDPCGAGNASWDVPADTAGIDWRLEDGNLTAYAIAPHKFTDGTSSVAFGKAPDSGASCVVPVTVDATFTDNTCVGNTYVAPTMSAPAVAGTSKDVTGNVAPGATVTVTYTALDGHTITGQSAFTHTFPALPSSAAYCDRPADKVVDDAKEGCDLSQYGDFQPGTIRRTGIREHVWDAQHDEWVLEAESGISWDAWTQAAGDVYGDQEYFAKCAPAEPEPVTVDDVKDGCDLSQYGDFEAGVIRRTGEREYVWDDQTRSWVLEATSGIAWGPWSQGAGDVYTDQEYLDACAPGQPEPKRVIDTNEGCDLSSYGDFEAGVIRRTGEQEYLWNAQTRAWELEPAAAISWGAWSQLAGDVYGDDEYFTECAPGQPGAEEVRDSQEGCDLSTYGDFDAGVIRRTGLQDYVWNGQTRAWELEDEALVSWGPWTQAAADVYTDDEYFAQCAPEQPKDVTTTQEKPGCDLSYYGDFQPGVIERDGVQSYLWNAYTRSWELGQVAWGPWTQSSTYTDEEYFELCAPGQPEAEPLSDTASGCDLSQYGDFESGVIGRTGEQPYVWNAGTRAWELGEEVWGDWTQTSTYTDEEYFELCASGEPEPVVREVAGVQASCGLGGVSTWVDTYTTPYVWNAETRTWELGEETGPVRSDEQFEKYTAAQKERLCTDVKGDEGETIEHEQPTIEVKGAQTGVPTEVAAGEAGSIGPLGVVHRNPLWLLAVGGGLGLMGFAGSRRRRTADR
jgi:hypothetical protein